MLVSSWLALTLAVSAPDLSAKTTEQLVQTGITALKEYRYAEAEAAWREILKRDPKNYNAYIQLGNTLKSRQPIAAKEAYETAISINFKRAEGYLRLAEALMPTQVNEAISVYRQAIAVAEPNAEIYYMLGIALLYDPFDNRVFSAAEKNAARDAFRQATQVKSQDTKYIAASYVALAGGFLKGQEQIDAYKAAIGMNYLAAYMSYGNLLQQQNRLNEMVPLYQKAIQNNPKAPNIIGLHNLLGRVLVQLNRWNEAEATYRTVLALNPNDVYVYFSLGDALKNQGKSKEAVEFYQKAAEIVRPDSLSSPGSIFSYGQVGDSLRDRGLLDLALKTYQKAIVLEPKNYAPYAWVGKTLQMQGKPDEAFSAIRQSIRLNPYGESGKTLQQEGKLEDAEKALRTAISVYEGLRTGLSDANKVLVAETQATTYQCITKSSRPPKSPQ